MVKVNCVHRQISFLVAAMFLAASAGVMAQADVGADAGEKRVSVTTQFTKSQRDRGDSGAVSQDEFPALTTQHEQSGKTASRGQMKTSATAAQSPNTDFWFYRADIVLFNDHDRDGYYHGIDLLFDADTYYEFAEVYAVVYLSLDGGSWNEYAVTDNFSIFGASSDDEYVIVTELVSGYPSGSYDLLIELFDTYDDSFVASFGPNDTSALAFLQLEDADRDAPRGGTTIVVTEQHGGGSLGWATLLTLLLVVRWTIWLRADAAAIGRTVRGMD